MSLPVIFMQPNDADSWRKWAFSHAAIHFDVNGAVFQQKAAKIQEFQLNPIDPDNLGFWLYAHQISHQQTNQALGLQGYDLLSLDPSDTEGFAQWLQQHGDEHLNWNKILGV